LKKVRILLFILSLVGFFVAGLSIWFNWSLLMKSLPHLFFFSGLSIASFSFLNIKKNTKIINIIAVFFSLLGVSLWGLSFYGVINLKLNWTYAVSALTIGLILSLYSLLIFENNTILKYIRWIFLISLCIPIAFILKYDNVLFYEVAEIFLIVFSVVLIFISFLKRT
jgi:hypothetical protein